MVALRQQMQAQQSTQPVYMHSAAAQSVVVPPMHSQHMFQQPAFAAQPANMYVQQQQLAAQHAAQQQQVYAAQQQVHVAQQQQVHVAQQQQVHVAQQQHVHAVSQPQAYGMPTQQPAASPAPAMQSVTPSAASQHASAKLCKYFDKMPAVRQVLLVEFLAHVQGPFHSTPLVGTYTHK